MRRRLSGWLDVLLLMAIAALSLHLLVLLSWPMIEAWRHRPRRGIQVEQHYDVVVSEDSKNAAEPVDYLIYLPSDYTRRQKWPLVVYLHGSGSRGRDLNIVRREGLPGLVEQGKKFDFVLLSPQCPLRVGWNPEVVVGLIEHVCRSLSVDRERVYMTGYSMGGFGAWNVAAYDPGRFAAIAPLAGGGDVSQAKRLATVAVWAFHGAKDRVVPLEANQAMVDAVRQQGGRAKLTVFPDGDHGVCGTTYGAKQFYEWLLAQRRIKPSRQSR
jgi:predicted peptidase